MDLLNVFKRKVRVTDVARAGCLRYPDKTGARELEPWFQQFDGELYRVVDTPLLDDWLEAVAQEKAGDQTHPSRGIGDASITWLISRLNSSQPRDEVILLLSDDGPFGDGVIRVRHPEVYMLSTRLFLRVLQNFDVIPSAEAIMEQIVDAGRTVAKYAADRPGRIEPGVRSEWTDVLIEHVRSKGEDGP